MFEHDGWTYDVGYVTGRKAPALFRTQTGKPVETIAFFTSEEASQEFIKAMVPGRAVVENRGIPATPKAKS